MRAVKYVLSLLLAAALVLFFTYLPSLAFTDMFSLFIGREPIPLAPPPAAPSPPPSAVRRPPVKKSLTVPERADIVGGVFTNSDDVKVVMKPVSSSAYNDEEVAALRFAAEQFQNTFIQFEDDFIENVVRYATLNEITLIPANRESFVVYGVSFDSTKYDKSLPSLSFRVYLDRDTGLVMFIEFLYTYSAGTGKNALPDIGGGFYSLDDEISEFAASWGTYLGMELESLTGDAALGEMSALYTADGLTVRYGLSFLNYPGRFYQVRIIPLA